MSTAVADDARTPPLTRYRARTRKPGTLRARRAQQANDGNTRPGGAYANQTSNGEREQEAKCEVWCRAWKKSARVSRGPPDKITLSGPRRALRSPSVRNARARRDGSGSVVDSSRRRTPAAIRHRHRPSERLMRRTTLSPVLLAIALRRIPPDAHAQTSASTPPARPPTSAILDSTPPTGASCRRA